MPKAFDLEEALQRQQAREHSHDAANHTWFLVLGEFLRVPKLCLEVAALPSIQESLPPKAVPEICDITVPVLLFASDDAAMLSLKNRHHGPSGETGRLEKQEL